MVPFIGFCLLAALAAAPLSGADPEGGFGAPSVASGLRPAAVSVGRAVVAGREDTAAVAVGPVSAFGAAADDRGRVWLAVGGHDAQLRVFRTDSVGWIELLRYDAGDDIRRIEVATGPGESAAVFVFFLSAANHGDLRALRINQAESLAVFELDIAVGPDTITSFAVAADRDRRYYLYCLYANETRCGRNAAFTRSLDFGKSWEVPQGWWNCWDPALAYGSGSTVHAAWRYAVTGREIHVQTSRYCGRPRSWYGHRRLSRPGDIVTGPTIAQLDTVNDARGAAWAAWTVADRYGRRRRVEYARSDDGGAGWTWVGAPPGEDHLDRWAPVLAAAPGRPYGPAQLGYVAGRVGSDTTDALPDKTTLRWRTTTHSSRTLWSDPAGAGAGPVASGPGVKPRMVIPVGSQKGWPVFLYSRRSPQGPSGVYAAWAGLDPHPAPPPPPPDEPALPPLPHLVGRTLRIAPVIAPTRLEFFDAVGRRLGRSRVVMPGEHEIPLAADLPVGPLFVRLTGPGGSTLARLVVVR